MLLKCQQGDLAKRRHAILEFDRATVCSAVLLLAHFGCVTASRGTAVPSAEKAGFSNARSYILWVFGVQLSQCCICTTGSHRDVPRAALEMQHRAF